VISSRAVLFKPSSRRRAGPTQLTTIARVRFVLTIADCATPLASTFSLHLRQKHLLKLAWVPAFAGMTLVGFRSVQPIYLRHSRGGGNPVHVAPEATGH